LALFGSTSETVRGSTESHLTRPGMEPAILGLPGTCRGRKLGDKPTVDIGSTSIFMQSPISFAWLRTRPVRRPHWISNPYSLTDKSEAAADGRSWLPPWPQTRHLLPRRLRRPVGESVRPPAPAVDRFGSPCSFRQSAPCSRSPWSTAIIGWPLSSQWASLRPGWPRPSC
jgi:hypothetical protein